ncbi:MAG: hypothetical protein JNJ83_09650 [Verrucomicrobiaceae bacterium]|nr:hypothetical protein [Verrucomicrobiaceae bacterium]
MATTLTDLAAWALDPERTLDERYLLLLLTDACRQHRYLETPTSERPPTLVQIMGFRERKQAQLTPLELPRLSLGNAALLAEVAPHLTSFISPISYSERAIGEAGSVLRFFPALETLALGSTSMKDISFLESLTHLVEFQINSGELEDLSPFVHCTHLKRLSLGLSGEGAPHYAPPLFWLDTSPLAALVALESLTFSPNPAALSALRFPKLTTASFGGERCVQRDCTTLPDMPALRFLTLSGVQSLRGIQRYPELRHLIVRGSLRDFGDLPSLQHLDCLEVCTGQGWPRRLEPLTTLPALEWVRFTGECPRNYWPLSGAPKLCQLEVTGCPIVALDVAAINAALPSWDMHFSLPVPRPLQPLRFIAVDHGGDTSALPVSSDTEHPDYTKHPQRFVLELIWMFKRLRALGKTLVDDETAFSAIYTPTHTYRYGRVLNLSIESIDAARRLPEVVEAIRQQLAYARHTDWLIHLSVNLRIRYEHMSADQKRWLDEMKQDSLDDFDDEHMKKWSATQKHILETQYRIRASEDAGEELDPEEFDVPEILSGETLGGQLVNPNGQPTNNENEENPDFSLKPFDEQEQNPTGDDDDSDDNSDIAIAPPPEPPPSFWDDPYGHPLAATYRIYAMVNEQGLYHNAYRTLPTLCQLMGREPDEYYPATEPPN